MNSLTYESIMIKKSEKKLSILNRNDSGHEWNYIDIPPKADKVIHQLFENQVNKLNSQNAVCFEDHVISYKELNQKANQLAKFILEKYLVVYGQHASKKTVIAVAWEQSIDFIIALIAIIKTGVMCFLFNPLSPKDYVNNILQETKPEVIIGNFSVIKEWQQKPNNKHVILLDSKNVIAETIKYPGCNVLCTTSVNDIGYIFYSIDENDKLKRHKLRNRDLINLAYAKMLHLNLTPDCCTKHHFPFDLSEALIKIFATFFSGAALCIHLRDE